MDGSDKRSKWDEMRKNMFQRRLTQQMMDIGVDRPLAIRHAKVTIDIAVETFDSHNKSVSQIIKNNFKQSFSEKKRAGRDNSKVVYLSPAPWQPNPVMPS